MSGITPCGCILGGCRQWGTPGGWALRGPPGTLQKRYIRGRKTAIFRSTFERYMAKVTFWGLDLYGRGSQGGHPRGCHFGYLGVVCQHDVSHLGCIINHMLHQIPGCVVWGTPRNVSFWGGTYRVLRLWQSTFGGVHMGS